jgi:hypothetical protein
MKVRNLATLYNLPPLDWATVQARLEQPIPQAPNTGGPNRHTVWLATINPDGRPHLTGVGALFVQGTFWFESGDQTQKARNLARDSRCALTLSTQEFDLVIEGEARKVTDSRTVARMAAQWAAVGWPVRVDDTGTGLTAEYSAPSAGPPPWYVYRVVALKASAVSTVEPGGATRWEFDADQLASG